MKKSIINTIVLSMGLGMLVGGLASCNKKDHQVLSTQNPAPNVASLASLNIPAGYDGNDYTKVYEFLQQLSKSDSGGGNDYLKNADYLGVMLNTSFVKEDPSTWTWNTTDLTGGFYFGKKTPYKLDRVDTGNTKLAGILDLSRCDQLEYIICGGSYLTKIILSNKSKAARTYFNWDVTDGSNDTKNIPTSYELTDRRYSEFKDFSGNPIPVILVGDTPGAPLAP